MTAMPPIFFGHGDPMHALREDEYTSGWKAIGEVLPHPKAIVSIS